MKVIKFILAFGIILFNIDLWHKANPLIEGSKYWIGCEIIGKIVR